MYITRQVLHVFYQQVHQNVAKQLGIKNHEWKSASELADEIQIANSVVANKLKSFISAYQSWFKVHEEIDIAGTTGNLSPEQNEKLLKVIDARDSTWQELMHWQSSNPALKRDCAKARIPLAPSWVARTAWA